MIPGGERTGCRLAVADTGVGSAAENIRIDRARLGACARGEALPLLRFYRLRPAAVVGYHQMAACELRLDYCRRQGIETVRRLTGGGALYVDDAQLAWSLVLPVPGSWRRRGLAGMLEGLCGGVAEGLRRLGLDPRFKAPNDLEIGGRKIASCYLARAGDGLLFHGSVLEEVDIARTLKALRVPTEKLSPNGLAGARQRLTTLRQELGDVPPADVLKAALAAGLSASLGLAPGPGTADLPVAGRVDRGDGRDIGIGRAIAVDAGDAGSDPADDAPRAEALWRTPGGLLRARLGFDADGRRLASVRIAGDVLIDPIDLFDRLENELRGTPIPDVHRRIARFLAHGPFELWRFSGDDLQRVVRLALDRLHERRLFGVSLEQANRLTVMDPDGSPAADIVGRAGVVLVPYCAKPSWCKWRHRDGCSECGLCEVGEAYRLGRQRGLPVVTITDYDHLCRTFAALRRQGVEGFIGMCCQNFFIKRHRAFRDSGLSMVLMDITGSNCYELGQEEAAYRGAFEAKADLDIPLLRAVMRRVPSRTPRTDG